MATKRAQEDQRVDRENRRNLEDMQRQNNIRMQESRVDWARQQLKSDEFMRSPRSWIQSDRENYKREQEQLKQLQDRQRLESNRATAY